MKILFPKPREKKLSITRVPRVMAIHIQSGKNNLECHLRYSKVQSIPCIIHADVDAPVSKYFDVLVKTTEQGSLTGSFRGFPLKGTTIQLPEGYIGAVFHESIRPDTEKQERKFYVVNQFKEIIYWNWDKAPSKNDAIVQALDWIDIADALHSPITEE